MVRAHPTVPLIESKSRQATLWRARHFPRQIETGRAVLLANSPPFTHTLQSQIGGISLLTGPGSSSSA